MDDILRALINQDNFRTVFLNIKQKTDELLAAYNNVDFLENPAVPVRVIALANGILAIEEVHKDKIAGKHATLENGVIKLSDEDSPVEQNFSVGHEMDHDFKGKADERKKEDAREQVMNIFKKLEIVNILDEQLIKQARSVVKAAARSNYGKVIQRLKKYPCFTQIAQSIAENASAHLGKQIPEDKAYNSIAKLICTGNSTLDNDFIHKATDDLYNEEVADYFAANLLVPVERFVLWEDRPDEEIAAAFKVSANCIAKRREEIKLELVFLAE